MAEFTVVHSILADGEEFLSVVVKPGLSDVQLTAVAMEIHRQHSHSHVTIYDEMNIREIKHYWTCFLLVLHSGPDNATCDHTPDQWASEHNIGSVGSFYDNAERTGQPKWYLDGKHLRRIAYIGTDEGVSNPKR